MPIKASTAALMIAEVVPTMAAPTALQLRRMAARNSARPELAVPEAPSKRNRERA